MSRATQQYVDCLVKTVVGPPPIQSVGASDTLTLAQVAQAVAVGVRVASAADSLTIAQTATAEWISRQAHDILSLTQAAQVSHVARTWSVDTLHLQDTAVAQRSRPIVAAALNVLNFQDVATVLVCKAGFDQLTLTDAASYEKTTGVRSTLVLQDTASRNVVLSLRHTDTLAIVDTALATTRPAVTVFNVTAQDQLTIQEYGSLVQTVGTVSDYVWLQDQASFVGPRYVSASDALVKTQFVPDPVQGVDTVLIGLQDFATANLVSAAPRAAHDALSFGFQAIGVVIRADAIPAVAQDSLTFTSVASRNQVPGFGDQLALADAATASVSKPVADTLTLGDLATVSAVHNLSASDTIVLEQSLAFVDASKLLEWLYHPFIGTGASGPTTPPPATLTYTPVTGVAPGTLVYPVTPPYSDWLTLRSPDLGNKDRLQFNRVSRESRGGTLIVFADPMWPKVQTQVLTFSGLKEQEARSLLDFMAAHLGMEVGYVDWESRLWTGIITNPTEAMVQDGRGMFTVSFEFEGELVT